MNNKLLIFLGYWVNFLIVIAINPSALFAFNLDPFPLSTWSASWENNPPDPAGLGAFGIGNGQVFALLGLSYPLNTLHNLLGPRFGTASDAFGDIVTLLDTDQGSLNIRAEKAFHIAQTPIVYTSAQYGNRGIQPDGLGAKKQLKIELNTQDFAPPNIPLIIRKIEIKNLSTQTIKNLNSYLLLFGEAEGLKSPEKTIYQNRGLAQMILYFPDAKPDRIDKIPVYDLPKHIKLDLIQKIISSSKYVNKLSFKIPILRPGQTIEQTVFIFFDESPLGKLQDSRLIEIAKTVQFHGIPELFNDTLNYWKTWFAQGVRFNFPVQKITDLFDEISLTIKLQQDEQGAVSPLNRFRGAWLRDTFGPMLAFLHLGRSVEALSMADYLFKASVFLQKISNHYPSSLPLGKSLPADMTLSWWTQKPFMPGFKGVEAPSFLVLQLDQYRNWTGDITPMLERYNFLKWALLGQLNSIDKNGLLPLSGDETWRPEMVLQNYKSAEEFLYYGEGRRYSVASHFLMVKASLVMSEIAEAKGELEDSKMFLNIFHGFKKIADHYYWQEKKGHYSPWAIKYSKNTYYFETRPLLHVGLEALWSGFFNIFESSEDNRKAHLNFANMVCLLSDCKPTLNASTLTANKTIPLSDSILDKPVITGMEPGLLLWNASELDFPSTEEYFKNVLNKATPSGNYHEFYQGNSRAEVLDDPFGGISNSSSTFRPWESGINLHSILKYLFGVETKWHLKKIFIHPHLPTDWPYIEAKGIKIGTGSFDIKFEKTASNRQTLLLEPLNLEKGEVFITFTLPKDTAQPLSNAHKIKITLNDSIPLEYDLVKVWPDYYNLKINQGLTLSNQLRLVLEY